MGLEHTQLARQSNCSSLPVKARLQPLLRAPGER